MTSNHDGQPGGVGLLLTAAGAPVLMVACCALLPLLVTGGAIAGIGAFLRNPWVIGAGIGVVVLAVVGSARRHRRTDSPDCCPPTPPTRTDQTTDTRDEQTR